MYLLYFLAVGLTFVWVMHWAQRNSTTPPRLEFIFAALMACLLAWWLVLPLLIWIDYRMRRASHGSERMK